MKLRTTIVIAALFCLPNSVGAQSQKLVDSETFDRWMSDLSNWGRWGKDDERGTVNLITPDKRIEAARLVQKGIPVSLARDVEKVKTVDNPYPFEHEVNSTGLDPSAEFSGDRYSVQYHGLAHSHLDALCHVFYDGNMYNGFAQTLVTETGGEKLSVRGFADGIFTRGVLIDIAWLRGVPYLEPETAILPEDLDAWTKKTGVEIRAGDVVLIRTGKWARRDEKGAWDTNESLAGLHASSAKWLADRNVAVVGTDAGADVLPSGVEGQSFPVHKLLIVAMGTPIFDNLELEDLSEEAQRQGRWDFLFTAAPLAIPGGTGSPLNPTAIF